MPAPRGHDTGAFLSKLLKVSPKDMTGFVEHYDFPCQMFQAGCQSQGLIYFHLIFLTGMSPQDLPLQLTGQVVEAT